MAIGSSDLRFRILLSVLGQNAVKGLADNISNLSKKADLLGSATKLFGTYLAVDKIRSYGQGILDTADHMNDLRQKTGESVKTLASFEGMALQSGLSTEQLAKSLARLSINTIAASNGNRVLQNAFSTLGISIKNNDGTLKSSGTLTKEIADKFVKLKDGPEKAALAVKLFGKSGQDLIPFLNEGSEGITKFGLAIDQDFASRADQFNDTITQIGFSIKNGAIGALKQLLPTLQEIGSAFLDFTKNSSDVPGVMDVLSETARIMSIGIITAFDGTRQALDQIVTFFRKSKAQIMGDYREAARLDDEYNKRREKAGLNYFKTVDQLRKNSLLFGEGSVEEIKKRQQADTAPKAPKNNGRTADVSGLDEDRGADKVRDFIAQQRLENDQRRDSLNDINLTAVEQRKLTEERKFELEVLKASKGLNEEQTESLKAQSREVLNERMALIQLQEQQKETWSTGAKQALKEYAENARDVASQVKNVFEIAFRDMEDAITNFVKGGKLDFKKFADDVITEVIRIQVRMLIAQAATGAAGLFAGFFSGGGSAGTSATVVQGGTITNAAFAKGGIMTSRGPARLKAYAQGGIANSPQMAVFGEGSRPEAYVPLPDGRSIPVTMKAPGGNGDVNVSVSVSVEKGEASVRSDSDSGADFGRMIGAAVKGIIIQEKRPGGLLA